jgi:ATP-dependent Clp protease ATP-binding subunit ClpC
MFFDRYTEDARRAVAMAKEEAANVGSPHIEAEHLALGVARAVEPDLKELLRLKELEDTLRSDLRAHAQFESRQTPADLPLSNPGKRILAYAAEEAVRLNSPGIGSGHLLLGVLRESESIASRLDVSTTQRSYIKTVPRVVSDAMRQLEEKIARAADVQQVSVN